LLLRYFEVVTLALEQVGEALDLILLLLDDLEAIKGV